jgi:urease accessory protein
VQLAGRASDDIRRSRVRLTCCRIVHGDLDRGQVANLPLVGNRPHSRKVGAPGSAMNLGLLQIADSALPIGGYTHSWGLEAAIAAGVATDPASLERWTLHWLRRVLGPFEGVLVAASCRAARSGRAADVWALNRIAEAGMAPASLRRASREMGEQLLELGSTWIWCATRLAAFVPAHAPERVGWHHAVVFGLLAALADGEPRDVLAAYLHQAALGMIGAGVRAIPVGHTHGQQVLAYLHDEVRDLAATLCDRDPATAGSGCPFYEVLCDEQTRLYARMFRS